MERVFNEDKTQELTEYDLTLGKLVKDKLFVAHHEAVPEASSLSRTTRRCRKSSQRRWRKRSPHIRRRDRA